jgi:4-hydroxy-tetrahydrodipicolinate reductase
MKNIKILLIGSNGRMGKILKRKILSNKKFNLINSIDKNNQKELKNDIKKTDVIIDFSAPSASIKLLKLVKKFKKKIIIGTTGFSTKDESLIKKISRSIAIFKSGNMSLGINLVEYISKILSKKIPNDFQISVYDDHHKKKKDYPSGTALMLANAIANGKNKNLNSMKGKIFLNNNGKSIHNKINFYITRKGKTIGKHSVNFDNKIEKIEVKHTSNSRELFAEGALKAALWIKRKKKGLFDMQDLLNLK